MSDKTDSKILWPILLLLRLFEPFNGERRASNVSHILPRVVGSALCSEGLAVTLQR